MKYIKMKKTEDEFSISLFSWVLDIGCWGVGGEGGGEEDLTS
jgi:hypothetical protein